MRFDNRVALVTGAGRGIGAATARRLAAEGAVVVVSDVDHAPAQEVVKEIEAVGGKGLEVACDVTQRASVDAMFDRPGHLRPRGAVAATSAWPAPRCGRHRPPVEEIAARW